MPNQAYIRQKFDFQNRLYNAESFSKTWDVSPRDSKGRLRLRANSFAEARRYNESLKAYVNNPAWPGVLPDPLGSSYIPDSHPRLQDALRSADNQAYSRFRGKLYKGSASMGVTLGTLKESRKMIADRSERIGNYLDTYREKHPPRRGQTRGTRQSAASGFLEGEFGWRPLVEDIYAATHTAIQTAVPPMSLGAHGTGTWQVSESLGAEKVSGRGTARSHVSALIYLENPNLWLANRLGLINPATIAWDLVPWSFVANWFVNASALINSVTDFWGLSFDNQSVTRHLEGRGTLYQSNTYPRTHPGFSEGISEFSFHTKYRQLGSIPKPRVEFRLPEVNWELAAIASSLLLQKVRRFDRFLSF